MLAQRSLLSCCRRVASSMGHGGRRIESRVASVLVQKMYATATESTLTKPEMFCYQCEQTKSRRGCVTVGVCGKSSQVAALQDLLLYTLQGIAVYANRANNMGAKVSHHCDLFVMNAMFSTMTNVNFDPDRFLVYIQQAIGYREEVKKVLEAACTAAGKVMDPSLAEGPGGWMPESYCVDHLKSEGKKVGVLEYQDEYGTDLNGVRYMTVYGIKGMSAYASHASSLGQWDPNVSKMIYQVLDFLTTGKKEERHDLSTNLKLALKVGEINMRVMELLDGGHREMLGIPAPNDVKASPVEGKCILVSGHDMVDLYKILQLTEGTGINVYTHGEMLPAHSYPKLRQFSHLVGHFGGAWQNQKIDFAAFPGVVIVTTNCVIEPLRLYRDRLYTVNETGLHRVKHLDLNNKEHCEHLVEHVLKLPGFDAKQATKFEDRHLMVGFGREVLMEHAGQVLKSIDSGELVRLFVIGGCDGSEHKRSYFTTLAKGLPVQTLILTMGCAKYRINELDLGTLGNTGIPRILDLGQCNDSYGAILVAKALADATGTEINDLPLSLALSWFEQKAVAVLLSLLHLGIKNIKLGPIMPAFLTPGVQELLKKEYGISPTDIRHPLEDMEHLLKGE